MPALNRTQAEIPEGATILRNPQGTAQGLALAENDIWVVMLPGVPRELRAIFAASSGTSRRNQHRGKRRGNAPPDDTREDDDQDPKITR